MKFQTLTLSFFAALTSPVCAADLAKQQPPLLVSINPWSGFYAGGHLGYAFGNSNLSAPGTASSLSLAQTLDTYNESGSFFTGIQGGYNYVLPNNVLIGAEADASFAVFPNVSGFSLGGAANLSSPMLGAAIYTDNLRAFGTVRGRIGYALGNWLLYATGGFAWSRDQLSLAQLSNGAADNPYLSRFGWAVGVGTEIPSLLIGPGRLNIFKPTTAQERRLSRLSGSKLFLT